MKATFETLVSKNHFSFNTRIYYKGMKDRILAKRQNKSLNLSSQRPSHKYNNQILTLCKEIYGIIDHQIKKTFEILSSQNYNNTIYITGEMMQYPIVLETIDKYSQLYQIKPNIITEDESCMRIEEKYCINIEDIILQIDGVHDSICGVDLFEHSVL